MKFNSIAFKVQVGSYGHLLDRLLHLLKVLLDITSFECAQRL